jgi:hypothetical protein
MEADLINARIKVNEAKALDFQKHIDKFTARKQACLSSNTTLVAYQNNRAAMKVSKNGNVSHLNP